MPPKPEPRGFAPWEHEPDEFDRQADEDCSDVWSEVYRRDDLDDMDDDDLQAWLDGGRDETA